MTRTIKMILYFTPIGIIILAVLVGLIHMLISDALFRQMIVWFIMIMGGSGLIILTIISTIKGIELLKQAREEPERFLEEL